MWHACASGKARKERRKVWAFALDRDQGVKSFRRRICNHKSARAGFKNEGEPCAIRNRIRVLRKGTGMEKNSRQAGGLCTNCVNRCEKTVSKTNTLQEQEKGLVRTPGKRPGRGNQCGKGEGPDPVKAGCLFREGWKSQAPKRKHLGEEILASLSPLWGGMAKPVKAYNVSSTEILVEKGDRRFLLKCTPDRPSSVEKKLWGRAQSEFSPHLRGRKRMTI